MVVSGQVTPDNIMLDKVTLTVISEHLGDKHAELVPDAAAGHLVEREVDAERRARRSLTDAELTAVAQMAKRAEKHYKCPQDIEWALDSDLPDGENLLLLQSRPETVHSSKPAVPSRRPPAATSGLSPRPLPPRPVRRRRFDDAGRRRRPPARRRRPPQLQPGKHHRLAAEALLLVFDPLVRSVTQAQRRARNEGPPCP